MESVTGAINRVIFGEGTASDKPTTTDVEDRQSYQRSDPAGSSVISDEPTSTSKFTKPESASPMRHETPNTSTTSYGAGGDSGFGTPSYETVNKSGTEAAFPSMGGSGFGKSSSVGTKPTTEVSLPSMGSSEFGKSSSVDTNKPSTDASFPSMGASEFGKSPSVDLNKPSTETSFPSMGASEFGESSSLDTNKPTGTSEFGNSSNDNKPFSSTGASGFGNSSVDDKPLLSTTRSGVADSSPNTRDNTFSDINSSSTRNEESSFPKSGQVSTFDNEPRSSYLDDASTTSLTSGRNNLDSETPRGPTENTLGRDTAHSPAAGAQGSNITGMRGGEERPNVSTANEPTAEAGLSGTNPAASTANPAPKGVTGATGSGPGTAVEPSVGAEPSSGAQPKQKQQGADRPLEEPEDKSSSSTTGPPPGPPGAAAGVQKESKGEGTGEKYEKSTGMAADGGDFDATRPGAGREADRLLEEKGIHHGGPKKEEEDEDSADHSADHSAEGTGKVSTAQKIKEKLHIGHKK